MDITELPVSYTHLDVYKGKELMLTREIGNLARSHDAQAVVVVTCGEGNDEIFVNHKVIQPSTNVVIAVHDYVMPLDSSMRALLRGNGQQ